jgi:NAD(P)-dependent dehydrogenase (short-subunit alcohol dehydrogenase family)
LRDLASFHPAGRIGNAGEVAALAVFLASGKAGFINGAALELDGAIGSRLHEA